MFRKTNDCGPEYKETIDANRNLNTVLPRPTYLVIATHHIGGAEKRFLRIWLELKKRDEPNLRLIINPELMQRVCGLTELQDLQEYSTSILTHVVCGSFRKDLVSLREFANQCLESSVFHFVLLPPIIRANKHKYIYSMPASSFAQLNWKGIVSVLLGFCRSDLVDVLSPSVLRLTKRLFLWKRRKFTLTPGSFVDLSHYEESPFQERKNDLVFLGLLSREKQADRLFYCLPELHRGLLERGHKHITYRFIGRPSDHFDLKSLLESDPRFREVPIEVGFHQNPMEILRTSKVFFSVQRSDNYPSKSLLEAMACGNQVVVTDVGDSDLIAPRKTCYYVPLDFNASDLIPICSKILEMNSVEFSSRTDENKKHIEKNFCLARSLDYFLSLYSVPPPHSSVDAG